MTLQKIFMVNKYLFRYLKNRIHRQFRKIKKYYQSLNSILRKIIMVGITFMLILFFLLLIHPQNVNAADNNESYKYKYFGAYTVMDGDSLWDIASEYSEGDYKDYIEEVKNINNLTSDHIYAGEMLIIPYYSTEYK